MGCPIRYFGPTLGDSESDSSHILIRPRLANESADDTSKQADKGTWGLGFRGLGFKDLWVKGLRV